MSLCSSGLLMSALGISVIAFDIFNQNTIYIPEHTILIGIVAALFFTMCNYGYEIVNWVFLGIIPIYIFLKWIFDAPVDYSTDDDECQQCQKPNRDCGCPKVKKLGCPANPIRLETECGISRFT